MIVARHCDALPVAARGGVVAIGNFDGVHRGHQALIAAGQAEARAIGAPFGVLAFEPHPQDFFRRRTDKFRLTPFRPKAGALKALGVDALYALPFNAAIAAMTADAFIDEILVRRLAVRHVLIGADFQFGKDRAGTAATLKAAGARHGFGVTIFTPVAAHGEAKISSTDIRTALKEGRPSEAARLLGHWWTVSGHVHHGDKRGRTIGFPTANVSLKGYLEPALGVYAVRVTAGEGRFDAVANFGRRPTFDKQDTLLEVHLFDFAGDLYGRQVDVAFVGYIRPERRFDGLESLKAQIQADGAEARRILAATEGVPPL